MHPRMNMSDIIVVCKKNMLHAFLIVLLIANICIFGFGNWTDHNRRDETLKSERQGTRGTEGVDWDRILHFIPNLSVHSCASLFETSTSKNRNISDEFGRYQLAWKRLMAEFRRLDEAGVKGSIGAPFHDKLTMTYQELAREPWVKTVCEIGFNIGASSLAWLTVKEDLVLYSFDIGLRMKTPYMAKYMKEMYPARFHFKIGDSRVVVPDWISKHGRICDIVSIDGSHEYEFIMLDLFNFRQGVRKRNILVADDIYMTAVKNAWDMLKNMDFLQEHYRCTMPGIDIDFALGQYITTFTY